MDDALPKILLIGATVLIAAGLLAIGWNRVINAAESQSEARVVTRGNVQLDELFADDPEQRNALMDLLVDPETREPFGQTQARFGVGDKRLTFAHSAVVEPDGPSRARNMRALDVYEATKADCDRRERENEEKKKKGEPTENLPQKCEDLPDDPPHRYELGHPYRLRITLESPTRTNCEPTPDDDCSVDSAVSATSACVHILIFEFKRSGTHTSQALDAPFCGPEQSLDSKHSPFTGCDDTLGNLRNLRFPSSGSSTTVNLNWNCLLKTREWPPVRETGQKGEHEVSIALQVWPCFSGDVVSCQNPFEVAYSDEFGGALCATAKITHDGSNSERFDLDLFDIACLESVN